MTKVSELNADCKVFLVNEPLRRDDASGEYVRFLPLESASDFGDVVELTPKGNPGSNLRPSMKAIREGLATWSDGDFLVLVGDQGLLAYAASVVGEKIARAKIAASGRSDSRYPPTLRFLKWERRESRYVPLILREGAEEENREGAR